VNTVRTQWRGSARLGIGWGAFKGRSGDNAAHAHHAIQVLLAESPQALWTPMAGWQSYRGAVIGHNQQHQLAPTSEDVVLVYLDPDSDAGRRVRVLLADGFTVLSDEQTNRARTAVNASEDRRLDRLLVEAIQPMQDEDASMQSADPVIAALIAALPDAIPDSLPAARLAREAGLSTSRFLHRFSAHAGLPLRPYLRWRRLLTAMAGVMRGDPLTDAALAAGFADVAHFNRTVRRHFGITPGVLLRLNDRA
jgi:AraC-like DNA-binding protein